MSRDALDRMSADADARYRVVTSRARALNAMAEGTASDPLWLEAAAIAEAAGDPQRIFDALVGYDHVVRLVDQGEVVRLLGVVLHLVGPDDSPLRAKAMAWRLTHTMRAIGHAPDSARSMRPWRWPAAPVTGWRWPRRQAWLGAIGP